MTNETKTEENCKENKKKGFLSKLESSIKCCIE